MFENIENLLIAISRYFLIIVGALSFVGAILFLIYNLILISDKPNYKNDDISQSTFSDFHHELFPKKLVQNINQIELSLKNNSVDKAENLVTINPLYKDLKENISYHFNDSQEMIDQFSANITPRSLEDYIQSNFLLKISNTHRNVFLTNLLNLFQNMQNNIDIKKIGEFEARTEIIRNLFQLFYEDFIKKIEMNNIDSKNAEREASTNNIKGYSNMQYVLYGLAIYAIVVLYLMIFKVEIDLRRIPTAINEDKN
jgi:hypothetical protein